MAKNELIYYYRYDCYVDRITGEIIDLCNCTSEDGCLYHGNWESDGEPTHVSKETLKDILSDYI